jgi:hypothetical protein
MRLGALWIFIMHIADVYWYVVPQSGTFGLNHLDIGALMFCLGLFFLYFFRTLRTHPLIPIGDPRLARTLAHHQSH